MTEIYEILSDVGIKGLIDILIMSVIIYSGLVWFKRTKAIFVITGMFVLGAGYLIARELDLTLTVTVFQGFFAVFLIAVLVIFQEEIKQFFEFLARITNVPKLKRTGPTEIPRPEVDLLVNTISRFASERIGALVVLRGKDQIARHLDGGIPLDGEMSEELLSSLFDPHSDGHDGAVVIDSSKVSEFGTHLPLSKNLQKLGRGGTRHAAALGLSEVCDALCLVASEERGTIAVARNGELKQIGDLQELSSLINSFYREIVPVQELKPWKEFFRRNYREKIIAVAVTLLLWFVFVHESRLDFQTVAVPVRWTIAPGLIVRQVEPPDVQLTFSGPRREFLFLHPDEFSVTLNLLSTSPGIVVREISGSNVTYPEGLTFLGSEPGDVSVEIRTAGKR
ncbi:MAG: diadenylate cyclase [Ignavibacteria bacterium]|nr:diadenylate cyclase [Ignavibacteria bacterium]